MVMLISIDFVKNNCTKKRGSLARFPLQLEVCRVFDVLYTWIFNFGGLLCSELVSYPNKTHSLWLCIESNFAIGQNFRQLGTHLQSADYFGQHSHIFNCMQPFIFIEYKRLVWTVL